MATGKVKWFKGSYGFITNDYNFRDVYIHVSILRSASIDPELMIEGVPVDFEIGDGERGKKVTKITAFNGKLVGKTTPAITKPSFPTTQSAVGSLKFFNVPKNYGFLEVEGFDDIFFHLDGVENEDAKNLFKSGQAKKGMHFSFVSREFISKDVERSGQKRLVAIITSAPFTPEIKSTATIVADDSSEDEDTLPIEAVGFIQAKNPSTACVV